MGGNRLFGDGDRGQGLSEKKSAPRFTAKKLPPFDKAS